MQGNLQAYPYCPTSGFAVCNTVSLCDTRSFANLAQSKYHALRTLQRDVAGPVLQAKIESAGEIPWFCAYVVPAPTPRYATVPSLRRNFPGTVHRAGYNKCGRLWLDRRPWYAGRSGRLRTPRSSLKRRGVSTEHSNARWKRRQADAPQIGPPNFGGPSFLPPFPLDGR